MGLLPEVRSAAMNPERMEQLAQAVEKNARLDMEYFFADRNGQGLSSFINLVLDGSGKFCGTTCCIAGEAALLSGLKRGGAEEVAQKFLGLDDDCAKWLFYGDWSPKNTSETDYHLAAKVIRAMAKAGGVPSEF